MLITLVGQHPRESLKFFNRLGLYSTIFTYEDLKGGEVAQPDTVRWKLAYNCLETIRSDESADSLNKVLIQADKNKEAVYHAWLLAALTPWAVIPLPPANPRGKMEDPPATQAVKNGLKLSSSICNLVTGAVRSLPQILEWKKAVLKKQPSIHERDNLGMAIRRWGGMDGNWRLPVLFAILVEAMETTSSGGILSFLAKVQYPNTNILLEFENLFSEWHQFIAHLQQMDVMDAPSCTPLVDGDILLEELDKNPGKWTGGALEVCLKWQFRNPGNTDYSAAIEEVKARREELGIPEGRRTAKGTKAGKRRKKQEE